MKCLICQQIYLLPSPVPNLCWTCSQSSSSIFNG